MKYCAKLRTSPTERSEAGATLLAGSTIISEVCGGGGGGGGSGSGGGGGSISEEERRRRQQRRPQLAPRVLFLAPDAEAPAGVPRALLTLRAPAEVLAKLAGLATTARGSTSLQAVAVVDLPREADLLSSPFSPPRGKGGEEEASSSSSPSPSPPSSPPIFRRLLALDGVQDPGNVGTLARAALALGWDGLYCLPGTADPWGDKAARAARGAAWRLPVRGGASSSRGGGSGGSGGGASWGELLEVARAAGRDVMVAEPREEEEGGWDEKKPPDASSKKNPKERGAGAGGGVCLVLGSEGSGLSAEGRAALASYSSRGGGGGKVSSVSIPMTGEMESLNVATAGAVLMFALSEGAGDFVRKLEER